VRLAVLLFAATLAWGGDDISLKDANGHKVRLRDLHGKIVVLNFWATWCGPCNAEMPLLVRLEHEYSGRGVVFIGASLDDAKTRDKIAGFIASHQVDFPVWYGATADDLDQLKLGGAVPDTAFVDADGRIVARILGQAREQEVRQRLDWLLSGRPDPAPPPVVTHLEK
jgi:thiol-disulfide isomerase/thioredoxin